MTFYHRLCGFNASAILQQNRLNNHGGSQKLRMFLLPELAGFASSLVGQEGQSTGERREAGGERKKPVLLETRVFLLGFLEDWEIRDDRL